MGAPPQPSPEAPVRAVLARYQELYRARDQARLDEVMELFVADEEPEMVGTEAVRRGDPDWALGRDAVRALTEWDWRSWYDVTFDLEAARVTTRGEVAWVTMPAQLGDAHDLTFTAVLVQRGAGWRFHTTHWAIAAPTEPPD
jgi:hypothetical protein